MSIHSSEMQGTVRVHIIMYFWLNRAHSFDVLILGCCEYIQCSCHLNSNVIMFDCCEEAVVHIMNIAVCLCVSNIFHSFGVVGFDCCENKLKMLLSSQINALMSYKFNTYVCNKMFIYSLMEIGLSPLLPLRDVGPLTASSFVWYVHHMSTWG